MNAIEKNTLFIKDTAAILGFSFCGIAKAHYLDEDARRLEAWLSKGMHGNMDYMQRNFDLRVDPTRLVPGARSVITLLINYFPQDQQPLGAYKISKYAYGKDYHEVIREKLNLFFRIIKDNIGEINGRGFVDSAPVLERAWAQQAGMGWIGKNGNLITKQQGSFFFIASLITDLELSYDASYANDYCGSCTRCIDSCPTEAILPDKVIDGSKCISYYTIELRDSLLPEKMKDQFNDWIFGCDVCQDVCPWNRFSQPNQEAAFRPLQEIFDLTDADWEDLSEESFKIIFRDSPIRRTTFNGIKRNLNFVKKS